MDTQLKTLEYRESSVPTMATGESGGNGDDGHDGRDAFSASIYKELRQVAANRLRRMGPGQTLQPTALVHEVYERLQRRDRLDLRHRGQFFGAAACAMRDILIEHLRRRESKRRGGDQVRVDWTMNLADTDKTVAAHDILSVHNVLDQMAHEYPQHARVVMLMYFAGLTQRQIANIEGVAVKTIERRWAFARAWMRIRLEPR